MTEIDKKKSFYITFTLFTVSYCYLKVNNRKSWSMSYDMKSTEMIHVQPSIPGQEPGLTTGHPYVQEHSDENNFPGPLLSNSMQKEDLLKFIQTKSEKILQRLDEPNQKEAYFFWQIMELLCSHDGRVPLFKIAPCLFKSYTRLWRKSQRLVCKNKDKWCVDLERLLCSITPEEKLRHAIIQMAFALASNGRTFASHICYVVAKQDLGSCRDSSFDLIGCCSLPLKKSDIVEVIERTEVYEYVLFMTSGSSQPNFQKYKAIYANLLAELGFSAVALRYCESIAREVATYPSSITTSLKEQFLGMSVKLRRRMQCLTKEPECILNLLHMHKAEEQQNFRKSPVIHFVPDFRSQIDHVLNSTPKGEMTASRYLVGELLGQGGFGSVYAGLHKADGKVVAIKYMTKSGHEKHITVPGETVTLPLEVALMQMVSTPPNCDNIVELMEWFETPNCLILVMEWPSPCMDLRDFCNLHNGQLPEPLARDIMWQVLQAAIHCSDRRVLHRDIKPENLLINTETLQVKLIDFGCGHLLKDSPYTRLAGTSVYWPPELLQKGRCMGSHATVWSLGIVLYELITGDVPFQNKEEIIYFNVPPLPYLSEACQNVILCCLKKSPICRPNLKCLVHHEWFRGEKFEFQPRQQGNGDSCLSKEVSLKKEKSS